ncbi:PIF1-like helicase-domain-containing protein [Scleroderma citrinum]
MESGVGERVFKSMTALLRATDGFSGASGSGWDTIEEAISWLGVEPLTFAAPVTIVTNVNLTINLTDGVERSQLETSVSSTTTTPMGIPSRQQASLGNMPLVQTETYPPPCDARQLVEDPGLGRSRPAQSYDVPPPVPPQPEIILSNEQKKILNLVEQGKNIFFTGAAGTGKSVLLREIVNVLEEMYGSVRVARTAPTGVAGLNIGGTTIHSWAGIGLGKESAKRLLDRLSERKRNTWRMTAALIIDESWCVICRAVHY